MMICRQVRNGFTLVELLVVTAIFGIVMTAMYGIYESNRRSSYKQESVVEIQQNLRAAMSQIQRDILMAGFMLPFNQTPVQTAGSNTVTVRTGSALGIAARIEGKYDPLDEANPTAQFDSVANQDEKIQLGMQEMVDLFSTGDYVRVIRPGDFDQPVPVIMQVKSKDRTKSYIELTGITGVGTFRKGFMVVRVPGAGAAHPNTITYSVDVGLSQLERDATGLGNQVLASNITGLAISYILDDGSEVVTTLPANDPLLGQIRAIRVTLSGSTDPQMAGYTGVTSRALTSVIALRNR